MPEPQDSRNFKIGPKTNLVRLIPRCRPEGPRVSRHRHSPGIASPRANAEQVSINGGPSTHDRRPHSKPRRPGRPFLADFHQKITSPQLATATCVGTISKGAVSPYVTFNLSPPARSPKRLAVWRRTTSRAASPCVTSLAFPLDPSAPQAPGPKSPPFRRLDFSIFRLFPHPPQLATAAQLAIAGETFFRLMSPCKNRSPTPFSKLACSYHLPNAPAQPRRRTPF